MNSVRSLPAFLSLLLLAPACESARAENPLLSTDRFPGVEAGEIELPDLIEAVADLTGRRFLYDERVRGHVSVAFPAEVPASQVYEIFEAILALAHFVVIEGPANTFVILPARDAATSALEVRTPAMPSPPNDHFVTRVLPLRFTDAVSIASLLGAYSSRDGKILAHTGTNSLIVSDRESNIRKLLGLIEHLDVPAQESQIAVVPIRAATASAVANQLREFYDGGTSPVGGRRAGLPARAAPVQARWEASESRRFIPDDRTNSIIVRAPRGMLPDIERTIRIFDSDTPGKSLLRVYRVRNADAEELSQTLRGVASPPTGAQPTRPLGGGPETLVAVDPPTNSLILVGRPDAQASLMELIQTLDEPRPQVMVHAVILEVVIDNDLRAQSGVVIANSDIAIAAVTGAVSGIGSLADEVTQLAPFRVAVRGNTITVRQSDGTLEQVPLVQAILEAAATEANVRLLSEPQILTADNEPAELFSGENVPILTARAPEEEIVSPQSLTTSNQIQRSDVGIRLRVTPHITEGDTLALELAFESNDVLQTDPSLGPTTTNRELETRVILKAGELAVLGGFIQQRRTQTLTGVPFLSDIPILGWAFKSVTEVTQESELIIILEARIVRSPVGLRTLTVKERERFRKATSR